jgi:hypothetical protein
LGSDALGRYAETFPEDKTSRERLVGVMKEWMEHLEKLPDDTRNKLMDKTCANGFAYASRFSGNPAFLDFAAKNLVSDDKFFIHYRTGQCSAKNWSETQAGHRLIQVFMHDIDKQRHPERYK